MAAQIGSRARRLAGVRALRSAKGRREQGRFAFEGATLLAEAVAAGVAIAELYATPAAYETTPLARELDAAGTPTFLLREAAAAGISDLRTPAGIVAIAPIALCGAGEIFLRGGPVAVLADLNDPANAGTILRSADAFGCAGVIFGREGVDPYHPKVIRGSMGAGFRVALAVADPEQLGEAAARCGAHIVGLAAGGSPITPQAWEPPVAVVVGHERRGLGRWEGLCERVVAIPMAGTAESLSAAVAGSIALYEASRRFACQESTL